MLITVPEAARKVDKDPETVRRWIRAGKLRSQKVGTQHLIEESDLDSFIDLSYLAALPEAWRTTADGKVMPDWAAAVRRARIGH